MNTRYEFSEHAPKWITSDDSPFRKETREHLDRAGRAHPEVFELVARIQAKSPGEGSKEREWARKICGGNIQSFIALPDEFPNADDLADVLKLAAYRTDNSYAYFFQNYAQEMDTTTHARCDEVTRMIAPTICELQPQVAIGFAPRIFEAFRADGREGDAEALFTKLAQQRTQKMLMQRDRFEGYDAGKRVLAVADSMHTTPRNRVEAGMAPAIRFMQERSAEAKRG